MITEYHAKLYAHELSKRHSVADAEKLAGALLDAQVDLNPHQVEAALFAFKSPLSKGAILADEVGLGKTIEAGLVVAQKWTEGRRRMLVVAPANLRKQWSQEIEEKFFLPTVILEARNYNKMKKGGVRYPFEQKALVVCSYQFAARHADELMVIPWDLVIIDEAHRLRNVFRPDNRIGRTLKGALANVPKVLLTATPLQNSLMELYGLVSLIDDYAFGDAKSFRAQYARLGDGAFDELKGRLKPVCHRTLRRQVVEYVRYTNRIPITQEFVPTEQEQALYDMVSDYLRRPSLQALPSSQRTLMTLIMRKLLASSTFAIALEIDEKFADLGAEIIDEVNRKVFKNRVVNARERRELKFRKEVHLSEDFQALWDKIKHRTRYRVSFETAELIARALARIKQIEPIKAPRVATTVVEVEISDAGVSADKQIATRIRNVEPVRVLPDILGFLQKETELTRHTLAEILKKSGRLGEFKRNPQAFMAAVARQISRALHDLMLEGIKYEKVAGQYWEQSRIEQDGEEGIVRYLNNLYEVQNLDKSLFDAIEYESEVERQFAQDLDNNENVKLFVKLPWWFKVDTPIGAYNPDWAFVTEHEEKLYFVRETKSTIDSEELRTKENQKISCGKRHFESLGVDYAVVTSLSEVAM